MAEGNPKAAQFIIHIKFIICKKYFGPVKVKATKPPCHMAYILYEQKVDRFRGGGGSSNKGIYSEKRV